MTNHYKTHCLSTHLTTFASAFLVLSATIEENYMENKERNLIRISMNFISFGFISFLIFKKINQVKNFEKFYIQIICFWRLLSATWNY